MKEGRRRQRTSNSVIIRETQLLPHSSPDCRVQLLFTRPQPRYKLLLLPPITSLSLSACACDQGLFTGLIAIISLSL